MDNSKKEVEKNYSFAIDEKIIRIKSVGFGVEKNYSYCNEPVTYIGCKNGQIITEEYGILGKEYSDHSWMELKYLRLFGNKTQLSLLENCYIKRIGSVRIYSENINSLLFGTFEPDKIVKQYDDEVVLLLKATENYLIAEINGKLRILDERYVSPKHWEKVES